MDFDDILKVVGQFGQYQKTKYLLVCLVWILGVIQTFVSVFMIATPDHRCSLPSDILNSTDAWQNQSATHSALVDLYIPVDADGMMDSCHIYSSSLSVDSNRTKVKCDSWVYDTSERDETVVTKFNLVCDKRMISTLLTSMLMFGNMAGSIINGIISDRHGRRMALLTAIAVQFISGVVLSLSPDLYTVGIFRFMMGAATLQMFFSAFVTGMEIVGPRYRLVAGIIIQSTTPVGLCLLLGLGYALRNIMSLQLTITLPSILFISYYWFLPESARWLLVRGRVEEATEIIHSIAKTNGTELPANINFLTEEKRRPESIRDLRYAPQLLCRTIISAFIWMVSTMSYYGLSLNSVNLPGSVYDNLAFVALAELVGYLACFMCFISGRKWTHAVSMSIGGLALMSPVLIHYYFEGNEQSKNWAFIGLNQVGKVGATVGFSVIYFWSAEIFPTVLRNTLMGASSVVGKIGAIMAPYISDIGKIVPSPYGLMLTPLIFGVMMVFGGLLSIGLPETTGYDLPETIAEANAFPN